jgi:hypothetical protein
MASFPPLQRGKFFSFTQSSQHVGNVDEGLDEGVVEAM